MVKVLHIAPGFKYGGIESRLIDWYSGMDRSQIHFDVVKVTPDESNLLVDKLKELGAEVYSIPPLGIRTWRNHFREMKCIICAGEYDAIHSHSTAYGFYPMLLGKRLGISKRILHSRTTNHNPGDKHIFISRILSKLAIPFATDYFACSEEAGRWAFGDKRQVKVIRNGIVVDDFAFSKETRAAIRKELGVTDKEKIIGFAGRFSTAKNIPFLVDVFNAVHKELPNTRLLFVGDGPLLEEIKEKVSLLGLEKFTFFVGRQDNVNEWMNAMDVFVMPSLFEGFGTVAIEAQANGLPCVLSKEISRKAHILQDVYFLDCDDIEEWSKTIIKALDYSRNSIATKEVRKVGYDVFSTIKELENYYLN